MADTIFVVHASKSVPKLIFIIRRLSIPPQKRSSLSKGLQTFLSSGAPKERVLLFGVEVGGGESKDLHLHFAMNVTNFRDGTQEKRA